MVLLPHFEILQNHSGFLQTHFEIMQNHYAIWILHFSTMRGTALQSLLRIASGEYDTPYIRHYQVITES